MLMEHFLLLTLKRNSKQQCIFDINKRSLGGTPQDAIVYGSKMYIAIYGSNIIEIVDKIQLNPSNRLFRHPLKGKVHVIL